MFVRPLEDRSLQIPHVGVTGSPQLSRRPGRAITDRAVGDDWCILREQRDGGRRIGIGKDKARMRQMAYFPFRARAHVEQNRLRPVMICDPIRQLLGRNPLHVAKLAPERPLEEKPIDAPAGEQPKGKQRDQSKTCKKPETDPAERSGIMTAANHLKKSQCQLASPLIFGPQPGANLMSQHRSLKGAITIAAKRNVLKRFERVELLKKRGQWKETSKVVGLPKTKPDV